MRGSFATAGYWLAGLLLIATPVSAQHNHPPQDAQLHEQFYNTWMMPNGGLNRSTSCCNMRDCCPTQMRNVAGIWFAKRREDGQWIPVPAWKLEQNQSDPRESPDGQAHVCMPPPGAGDGVYCAVLGSGI
jgi:hypothetical protein